MHPKTKQFLEELEALCKKHGVSLFNPCCVDQIVTLPKWSVADMLTGFDTTFADKFFEGEDRRKADEQKVLYESALEIMNDNNPTPKTPEVST